MSTTSAVLPRNRLAAGLHFEGTRVALMGPQGTFKPAILPEEIALLRLAEGIVGGA